MFTKSIVQSTPRISAEDFDAAARDAYGSPHTDLLQTLPQPDADVQRDTEDRCTTQCKVLLPYVVVAWVSVWTAGALAIYTPMQGSAIIGVGMIVATAGLALIAVRRAL